VRVIFYASRFKIMSRTVVALEIVDCLVPGTREQKKTRKMARNTIVLCECHQFRTFSFSSAIIIRHVHKIYINIFKCLLFYGGFLTAVFDGRKTIRNRDLNFKNTKLKNVNHYKLQYCRRCSFTEFYVRPIRVFGNGLRGPISR